MSNNGITPERTPLLPTTAMDGDENLVEPTGPDDPLNATNSMPKWRKWMSAVLLGAMTFAATFSSAAFAAVGPGMARELKTTPENMALATSLFVFGFAAGPIFMGPASEVFGRKAPLFAGYLAFVLFQIPVALADDIQTVLIWRFLGGVASSGSPAIVGGYLADFLRPVERGVAVAIFAATTLIGPPVGAIVGSILLQSSLGWRWAAWLSMIMAIVFSGAAWFVVPETYMPVLLQRKARELRLTTGNWAFHTKADESPITIGTFISKYLTRPFMMLFREPILIIMTLYVSFTFGMIYFLFVSYSFSFVQERGWSPLNASLPLLGIIAGIAIGSLYVTRYTMTTYAAKIRNSVKITPEDRLPPMIIGGFILPLGLFCFSATSSPGITAWPQILSGVLTGSGIQILTLQSLAYVLDVYTVNANSAISGTVVVRSLLGGLFPIVAVPLYQRLHAQWATSVVALVASAFSAVPVLLFYCGTKIRSWSRYVVKN
ncbi:putative Major facilitator superfamily (MFS) profile domain-containing protein [Seiridium cardinale]